MEFSIIAKTLENMEGTTKRLELTDFLVGLFKETPQDLLPKIVYLIQGKIRPDFEGIELGMAEKLAIRSLSKSSGTPVKKIQEIYQDDGDLGHTAEKILQLKKQTTFVNEPITLERVYDTFFKIAKTEGKGSQDMKIKYISSLLNDAMPIDGKFILKILLGTLRLGVADNTIIDALTIAFTGSKEKRHQVEDAYNVSSDLGKVAQVISEEGINGVEKFQISIFNPVRPMLADRVKSESEALEKMGEKFAAEYKLDGERVQVHLKNKQVILFSRRLENITKFYPDIVENISKSLKTREAILEAEAVAVNENTGEFLPFQELMHRRRKYNLERAVSEIPITLNFFDVLYFDGKNCLGLSYEERRKNLEEIVS